MSSLSELLQKLETECWSGEVSVSAAEGNAAILLREGQFIWSHRPLHRMIERLSKVEWIKLPPEEVLKNCRNWEDLVRMILHANPESHARIVRLLKTERLELFFRLFFWSNMELTPRKFHVDLPDPAELGFYSPRKISTLLKEAQKRMEEFPQMQKALGSSKRIFVPLIEVPSIDMSNPDAIDQAFLDQKDDISEVLPYSPEEIELLRLCDGTHSVQDIVRLSLDGEFLILRRLMNLWEKGAVAPKDDAKPIKNRSTQVRDSFGAQELFLTAGLGIILCLIFGASKQIDTSHLRRSPSFAPLAWSLERYRSSQGRYPLTLSEMNQVFGFQDAYLDQFDYRLPHPEAYELMIK